jgi:hypothetical protein
MCGRIRKERLMLIMVIIMIMIRNYLIVTRVIIAMTMSFKTID